MQLCPDQNQLILLVHVSLSLSNFRQIPSICLILKFSVAQYTPPPRLARRQFSVMPSAPPQPPIAVACLVTGTGAISPCYQRTRPSGSSV